MTSPGDFHIAFGYKGVSYDLHLVKGKKSAHTVEINGKTYAVLGPEKKLKIACEILGSVSLDSVFSENDLQGRLSTLEGISFPSSPTSDALYTESLRKDLASLVPKGAGAMVAVSSEGEEPEFISLGTTEVHGGKTPNKDTAALIGSGAKMFTALLAKILEEKGALVLEKSMKSKLSDFMKEEHFQIFENPEAARNITLESLLSHTSGLQYFADDFNNARKGQSLDTILDGMVDDVQSDASRAVRFTSEPDDRIYSYSNQIELVAVCIEKAYKKILAKELIAENTLNEKHTLRELSEKVEPLRKKLHAKIEKGEKHLVRLKGQRDHAKSGSTGRAKKAALSTQIEAHEKRLAQLKRDFNKLPPPIPESALDVSLNELLDSSLPYITPIPHSRIYVYDLIDQFLMQFDPKTLTSSKIHQMTYADILKKELLQPLGMKRTSFQRPKDSNVLEACVIKEGRKPKTVKENILDPMMRGAGGLWSSPADMMKLAVGFDGDGELLAQDNRVLISKKGVSELAQIRGINGKTGLALDVEGSVIGKGGGISTYDFKFKFDTSTRTAMVSMCNFTGAEREVNGFISRAVRIMKDLNPSLSEEMSPEEFPEIDVLYLETQLSEADMDNCDEFFSGKQGYVGVKRTDFGIILNWNGIKIPARGKENRFVIFGEGAHDGKEILLKQGMGSKKTSYLFIEQGIDSVGFTKMNKENIIFPETLEIPEDVLGVNGTYKSSHPDGPKPIKVSISEGRLLFAYGKKDPVPGHIANIIRDSNEAISEIWIMTTAEDVPDKIYKLIKDKQEWSLAIALFENPASNLEKPFPKS